MIALPTAKGELLLILSDENIERMKRQDPAEFRPSNIGLTLDPAHLWETGVELGGPFYPLVRLSVSYASPEDMLMLEKWGREGHFEEIIAWARKGWEFRPDLGDSDVYERLKPDKE